MSTPVHIGKKIKELRKSLNMTQQDLAEGIVTRGFISQLEKGLVSASVDTLEKLAKRLHCDTSYLINGNQYSFPIENDDIPSILDTIESCIDEKNFELTKQMIERIPTNVLSDLNAYDHGRFLWANAYLQWKERKLEHAKSQVLKSIKLFKPSHEQRLGKSYNLLGIIYYQMKQTKESLHAFTSALYFSTKYPSNIRLRIETLLNLGILHGHLQEFSSAVYCLQEAESLNVRTDSLFKSGEIFMTLGICHRNQGKWDEAEQCYKKAVSICEILDNKKLLADVFTNLGVLYKNKQEYSMGKQYLDKAISIYSFIQEENLLLNAQMELLEILISQQDWQQTEDLVQRLDVITQLTPKQQGVFWLLKGKIELLTEQEYLDKSKNDSTKKPSQKLAVQYFTKAKEVFQKSNLTSSLKKLYKELGELYYVTEDYEKASTYYRLYVELE
jgi:transcriptional regulator with XRE-family HTH domain/Tfp pilus assembly protein PilF